MLYQTPLVLFVFIFWRVFNSCMLNSEYISLICLAISYLFCSCRRFRTRRGTLDVSASNSILTFGFTLGKCKHDSVIYFVKLFSVHICHASVYHLLCTGSGANGCLRNPSCDFQLNNFDVDISGRLLG